MPVAYEWDVEKVAVDRRVHSFQWDILDHNHSEDLKTIGFDPEDVAKDEYRLVLVRDVYTVSNGVESRLWAYAYFDQQGVLKLPEHFMDAYGNVETKVPKRFHKELERWILKIGN